MQPHIQWHYGEYEQQTGSESEGYVGDSPERDECYRHYRTS